jgi:hypothetical protein
MAILLSFFLFFPIQDGLPYKPKEEFEVKLNYEFRQRSLPTNYTADYSEGRTDRDKKSSDLLPYLILKIKLLKLPNDEVKVKGTHSDKSIFLNKKVQEGDTFTLDLGFTDDLKDYVTPHEYDLVLLNKEKKEINHIHLFVKEDGTFTINGEVRGKF